MLNLCTFQQPPEFTWKAWAMLWAADGEGKFGEASFRQISPVNPVLVNINATGLPMGRHAVHIHAFGDIREGCKSTGPHVRGILVSEINEMCARLAGDVNKLDYSTVNSFENRSETSMCRSRERWTCRSTARTSNCLAAVA